MQVQGSNGTGGALFRHGCADIFSRPMARTRVELSGSNAGNLCSWRPSSLRESLSSRLGRHPKSEKLCLRSGSVCAPPSMGAGLAGERHGDGSERLIAPGRRCNRAESLPCQDVSERSKRSRSTCVHGKIGGSRPVDGSVWRRRGLLLSLHPGRRRSRSLTRCRAGLGPFVAARGIRSHCFGRVYPIGETTGAYSP